MAPGAFPFLCHHVVNNPAGRWRASWHSDSVGEVAARLWPEGRNVLRSGGLLQPSVLPVGLRPAGGGAASHPLLGFLFLQRARACPQEEARPAVPGPCCYRQGCRLSSRPLQPAPAARSPRRQGRATARRWDVVAMLAAWLPPLWPRCCRPRAWLALSRTSGHLPPWSPRRPCLQTQPGSVCLRGMHLPTAPSLGWAPPSLIAATSPAHPVPRPQARPQAAPTPRNHAVMSRSSSAARTPPPAGAS